MELYNYAYSLYRPRLQKLKVNIKRGINNVNIIKLKTSNLDLKELEVIADIVKERVTPVAATTISAKYIEFQQLPVV